MFLKKDVTSITLEISSHFTVLEKTTVRFGTEMVTYKGPQIWNQIPDISGKLQERDQETERTYL